MAPERTAVPFLDSLRASGLLSDAQLAELAKCPEARDPAPTPLARVILQRGWLTRFQLNMIAAGSAKGLTVGPYIVLDRIGEGGMGMIYKARHQHMQRIVALKVIRKEKLASPDAVKRFYQEVQMAGTLQHPNIVLAYDAGQSGNTHYFAMEFIEGVDLSQLVKEKGPLPVPQACEYIRQVALGLQHAHEKGLVHRDIKPGNMLLSRGKSSDVVKLLDMGLARLQSGGDTGLTKIGAVIGTPDFLAPEQAMNSKAADIRADLYSLGCSLYYLLTGKPPFTAGELTEVLLKHQMEKPMTLAQRGVDVPKKVQVILDRLMAKQPGDRYQTPAELIEDLEPFCRETTSDDDAFHSSSDDAADDWAAISQDGKPKRISTSRSVDGSRTAPLSRAGAVVRPNRRAKGDDATRRKNRWLPLAIGGGVAGLAVLAVILYLVFGRSKPEPVAEGPKPTEPTRKAPSDDTKPKLPAHREGDPGKPNGGDPPNGDKPPVNPPSDLPPVEGKLDLPANEGGVRAVAFSPDGKTLAIGQGQLRLWDLGTNKELHNFSGKGFYSLRAVSWSADGNRVIVGGSKNVGGFPAGVLTVFDAKDGSIIKDFTGAFSEVHGVAISRDGKYVLSAGEDVRRWEVESGKEVTRYRGPTAWMKAVGFSNDEQSVYAAGSDGDKAAYVWPVDKPEGRRVPFDPMVRSHPVFSPHGREVVITTGFNWVVYDLASGTESRRSKLFSEAVWSLGWSRDGRFIAGGTMREPRAAKNAVVYLTDAASGKLLQTFDGHNNTIGPVAVSPDGGFVLSTSSDGAKLWKVGQAKPPEKPPVVVGGPPQKWKAVATKLGFEGHKAEVLSVSYSTDGKKLISSSAEGALGIWETSSGKLLKMTKRNSARPITLVRFVDDGTHGVAVIAGSGFETWEIDGDTKSRGVSFGLRSAWAISHNGEVVLYSETGGGVRAAWSLKLPGRDFNFVQPGWGNASAAAFAPDDETFACATEEDGMIHIGDPKTKKEVRKAFGGPGAGVTCLALAPKSAAVLTTDGKTIALWNPETGQELRKFAGPTGKVCCLAFSPDGNYAVSGHADGMVCYWEVETGRELKRGSEHKSAVRSVAFAPDGRTIVSCGDGIKLWDVQKP